MHLDILIDMKLLLCSVTSPGIAFLINRKLLLCSATSPRIALAILAKQSADFVPAAAVFACGYKWSAKEIYGMAVAVVFFADRVSDPDFQYV